MKKRRVLAGLMGVLAAVGAAATLQLGLTAPGKETAVLKMDPRVMEQAQEFGHGIKREIGYLTVHSVLHLLGYDHVDEGPMKRQMRRQEETIMAQLLLTR